MTMKTPEMEVVRFNESDVIVASGKISSFALTGFNNGTHGDATINGINVTQYEQIGTTSGDSSNSYFQWNNNQAIHLGDLHNNEENNVLGNGTYKEDGTITIGDEVFKLWHLVDQ